MIRRLLGEDLLGSLSPPTGHFSPERSINGVATFDSSLAVTILVLLTALFFMAFFSVYIRHVADSNALNIARRRQHLIHRPVPQATSGANPSVVRDLPLFLANQKLPFDDCPVCLGEFESKEEIKMIPACGHVFHSPCIDRWLATRVSCPVCRSTQLFPTKAAPEVRVQVLPEAEVPRVPRVTHECGEGIREGDERGGGEAANEGNSREVRRVSSCSSFRERPRLDRSCSF